jgi:hypothetical protein
MASKEPQPVHAVVGYCGQWHGSEEGYITDNGRARLTGDIVSDADNFRQFERRPIVCQALKSGVGQAENIDEPH